jgi:hypothetical protein
MIGHEHEATAQGNILLKLTYNQQMKYIYDIYEYQKNIELIYQFQDIYIQSFPDLNEREEFFLIKERIEGNFKNNTSEPQSI